VKGEIPGSVLKNVFCWMDLHKDELMANWMRLQNGEEVQKINPLM
jgi:hypothetical protein